MDCIIICGAPASGKSTIAADFVKSGWVEINRDAIRFSVIDPGGNWTTYRFNKKNEKEVTRIWWENVRNAAFNGDNVVISDTLCNKDRRKQVVEEMISLGYNVNVVELHVPLETLLERNANRGVFSVGESVIRSKFEEMQSNA